MKFLLTTVILVCLPARVFPQVSFPLHVGDNWGYNDYTLVCEGTSIVTVVRSDTVVNGRTYANFKSYSIFSGPFVRADSLRVFEYDTSGKAEFMLFDFRARSGDTVSTHKGKTTIALGSMRFAVYDSARRTASPSIYTVLDSIGVLSRESSPCFLQLTSAVINGKRVYPQTGINHSDPLHPQGLFLDQHYPNPFNSSTPIRFYLPNEQAVSLAIFNAVGSQVQVLQFGKLGSGWHLITWDAGNFSSGIYFYTLQTLTERITRGSLVLR